MNGDTRLVTNMGYNSTIFSLNSYNRSEACRYLTNNETIKALECNAAWRSVIEGRVEICNFTGGYGTICDNRWDSYEARVVCRQLKSVSEGKNTIGI